jgi:hypothetical protein
MQRKAEATLDASRTLVGAGGQNPALQCRPPYETASSVAASVPVLMRDLKLTLFFSPADFALSGFRSCRADAWASLAAVRVPRFGEQLP